MKTLSFEEWKRKWLIVEVAHKRAKKRYAKKLKAIAKVAEKRAA